MGQRQWRGEVLKEKKPLILFLFVIIVLMLYRGSGLRVLGSSTWGGMVYIQLIGAIAFAFAINGMRILPKHIRWIIWGGFAASLIGALLTYSSGPSRFASEGSILAERQSWAIPLCYSLLPISLIIKQKNGNILLNIIIFITCLGLIAMTGVLESSC